MERVAATCTAPAAGSIHVWNAHVWDLTTLSHYTSYAHLQLWVLRSLSREFGKSLGLVEYVNAVRNPVQILVASANVPIHTSPFSLPELDNREEKRNGLCLECGPWMLASTEPGGRMSQSDIHLLC